jgi:hypothetical protein
VLRVLVATAALGLVTGLAGCGGDTASGPLSAGDFRKEAQAICKDGNAAIDELAADFGKDGPTHAQLEEAAPKVPGLMDHELDRLAALEPPSDLADDVDAMLAAFRSVVGSMREQGTAFFDRTDEPFHDAYAKAAALGLDECAH